MPEPYQRSDREGTRLLAAHVAEEIHRAVRVRAAKNGTTVVEEMHAALYLLFQTDGNPILAKIEATLERFRLQRRRG